MKFKIWYLHLIIGVFASVIAFTIFGMSIVDLINQDRGVEGSGFGYMGLTCMLPNFLVVAILFDILAVVYWRMDNLFSIKTEKT